MLERLRKLHTDGLSERDITNELFHEFGAPYNIGEVTAELMMLGIGKFSYIYLLKLVRWADMFICRTKATSVELGDGSSRQGVRCQGYGC